MLASFDPTFVYANYVESGVWAVMGVLVAILGKSRSKPLLAVALIAFGVSDLVETTTGAWYRPWWLFVWKALCVLAIVGFGFVEVRAQKPSRADRASTHSGRAGR